MAQWKNSLCLRERRSWSPISNCAMDSTFDSLAAAAEAECRNHFIDDLVVTSQLTVRSDPPQQTEHQVKDQALFVLSRYDCRPSSPGRSRKIRFRYESGCYSGNFKMTHSLMVHRNSEGIVEQAEVHYLRMPDNSPTDPSMLLRKRRDPYSYANSDLFSPRHIPRHTSERHIARPHK